MASRIAVRQKHVPSLYAVERGAKLWEIQDENGVIVEILSQRLFRQEYEVVDE